jgi:hypothetical protein
MNGMLSVSLAVNQMEQQLYGAALYLNPGKFFAIREKDRRQAGKLRTLSFQLHFGIKWNYV